MKSTHSSAYSHQSRFAGNCQRAAREGGRVDCRTPVAADRQRLPLHHAGRRAWSDEYRRATLHLQALPPHYPRAAAADRRGMHRAAGRRGQCGGRDGADFGSFTINWPHTAVSGSAFVKAMRCSEPF